MTRFSLVLPLILLGLAAPLQARTFTDKRGKTYEGEVISTAGDTVTVTLNGRKLTTNLAFFSAEDQEYLKSWKQGNPDAVTAKFSYRIERKSKFPGQKKSTAEVTGGVPMFYRVEMKSTNPGEIKGVTIHCDAVSKLGGEIRRQRYTAKDVDIAAGGQFHIALPITMSVAKENREALLGIWIRVEKGGKVLTEFRKQEQSGLLKLEWDSGTVSEVPGRSKSGVLGFNEIP